MSFLRHGQTEAHPQRDTSIIFAHSLPCASVLHGTIGKCSQEFLLLFFRDRVSVYSPGGSGIHFVDRAGLELTEPHASASLVL